MARTGPFGHVLDEVTTTPTADVAALAADVASVAARWAQRPASERAAVLLRLHDLVLERRDDLLDLLQREAGKSRGDAFEEVASVCLDCRYLARTGAKHLRPQRSLPMIPGLMAARVERHPVGVVGVIAPWNYPLVLTLGEALPAVLAGNGVLVKPDPLTAEICSFGLSLLVEAGVPEGLVRQVDGGVEVGEAVVDAVDHVIFTGSTPAGREVGARAAHRLIGSTLELGGKNSMYVRPDAALPLASAAAVRGAFGNAGQLCLSVERLIVHERVYEEFLDRFLTRVSRLRLGNTLDFSYETGSQISARQAEKVQAHLDDARAVGAGVAAGGGRREDLGPWFVEPTVLTDLPSAALSYQEETFGPLVSVFRVSSDAEAMDLAQDTPAGLTGSIWTRDLATGRALASTMKVGAVSLNECYVGVWGSAGVSFGGVGSSGLGRRHGPEGVRCLTRPQAVVEQRAARFGLGLTSLLEQPPARSSAILGVALAALRRTPLP